jgi:hypothetical protein
MYLKDFLPPPCYAARSITTVGNHSRGSKESVAWHGTEVDEGSANLDQSDAVHIHQSNLSLYTHTHTHTHTHTCVCVCVCVCVIYII